MANYRSGNWIDRVLFFLCVERGNDCGDMKSDLRSINTSQGLYVLTCGGGYTCLGFIVCQNRSEALAKELEIPFHQFPIGTAEHYDYYLSLVEIARQKNAATGWRSQSELHPDLIGLEGKRVEAILYGERTRFIVGRSTGFIPCHLEIKTKRSHGGGSLPNSRENLQLIRVIR